MISSIKKKTDIVYSVTAHESPECVYNLYENIVKFHPGLSVMVIFHTSPDLYELCKSLPKHPNLLYHPRPSVKARFTCSLFFAHLDNYRQVYHFDFDYFCTLASNCMFVRPVDIEAIRKTTPDVNITPAKYELPDPEKWMWQEFVRNKRLVAIFKEEGIPVHVIIHEGAYFQKQVMKTMVHFCNIEGITPEIFDFDTLPAEEVLLPSIEKYITGKVSPRYGLWIPGLKMEDVVSVHETGGCRSTIGNHYTIMKVARDMENPIRKYINELPAHPYISL